MRLEAARAAAPYFHAKPKPVEFFTDAAVDLEARLAEARANAQTSAGADPLENLGERLDRAFQRLGNV